ncbi:hypothetical protein D9613_012660 [Agrocybe pediades]|uniref:Secreted protein n=1 Tax=Agrocybe pediades TaxID=84607 RepID=A0A8H4QV58_9AGAR|nr:hypothetical protein D9613_012660 [Agrocybe pediades]
MTQSWVTALAVGVRLAVLVRLPPSEPFRINTSIAQTRWMNRQLQSSQTRPADTQFASNHQLQPTTHQHTDPPLLRPIQIAHRGSAHPLFRAFYPDPRTSSLTDLSPPGVLVQQQ